MTKEKREKKKRNNFPNAFDRFNKKKRIVTLKFNIYSMITLQSRTLSIILCVFKSQEEDTRKKKGYSSLLVLGAGLQGLPKHFGTKQNGGSATAVITSEVMAEESR